MVPKIISSKKILLAGLSFFGDPFSQASSWDEENEIGRLWNRFYSILERSQDTIKYKKDESRFIEIHLYHNNTFDTGEYEIFCGIVVEKLVDIPLEFVIKILPITEYAIFTIKGKKITEMDWYKNIFDDWLPQVGYEPRFQYSFQSYDERFKGLNDLENSELDFYFPVKKIQK